MNQRAKRLFLWVHIGVLALLLLFPLYRFLAGLLPKTLPECFLHDFLFLYCPFCGGTRALSALLSLHLAESLRANLLVLPAVIALLCLDLRALFRLRRGERTLYPIPTWLWILLLAILLLYGVLRNLLMIRFGYDPLGDLGWFWNR